MPQATKEALAATRALARSLLAEALGVPPTTRMPEPVLESNSRRRWGPQTIIQAVEAFVDRESRLPRHEDWFHAVQAGLPSLDTVRRYWGSCAELHRAVVLRRRLHSVSVTPGEEDV